jgi:hypothetical protein
MQFVQICLAQLCPTKGQVLWLAACTRSQGRIQCKAKMLRKKAIIEDDICHGLDPIYQINIKSHTFYAHDLKVVKSRIGS